MNFLTPSLAQLYLARVALASLKWPRSSPRSAACHSPFQRALPQRALCAPVASLCDVLRVKARPCRKTALRGSQRVIRKTAWRRCPGFGDFLLATGCTTSSFITPGEPAHRIFLSGAPCSHRKNKRPDWARRRKKFRVDARSFLSF